MRFALIDRIVKVELGARIAAEKSVTLSEEYLQDHFPLFPVMPGVFMLEAAVQASAWLIRLSEDFQHSMVLLTEASNIKYANFVAPGHVLNVTADIIRHDERQTKLKIQGTVDGNQTVSGRLVLERFNLADTDPAGAAIDRYVINEQRKLLSLVYCEEVAEKLAKTASKMGTVTTTGEARI